MNEVKCPKCLNTKKVRDGAKYFLCCNSRHDTESHLTAWKEAQTTQEAEATAEAHRVTLVVEKPKVDPLPPKEEKKDLGEVYRYQCGSCGAYFDDFDEEGKCPNKKCGVVLQ